MCTSLALIGGAGGLVGDAIAEQASEPASPAAGQLDAGWYHSCAVVTGGGVRCWGYGASGQLGYGNTSTIGDDETPASAGPVNLPTGVRAIAAGDVHTCALLENGTVRCWGFGGDGRLGYASTSDVLDPGSAGSVDLGTDPSGRALTATAITAGAAHTCALLVGGSVRCWGYGGDAIYDDGRLGYGSEDNVGDNETPGSAGPVKLGAAAVAISAGGSHTCALLVGGTVRCWGRNDSGQLGYGDRINIGSSGTPDQTGPVNLGGDAVAISAGGSHTCALLDGGSVRCWGEAGGGQLGYGNPDNIGDDETPDTVGPVRIGGTAVAISAGSTHTCALLSGGSVRCWGLGASGRLGYGDQENIGDTETPDSRGPVDLGAGRTASAISAGKQHTCARLDGGSVRCWGYGGLGRLGYCNQVSIGDDETPGTAGPVSLEPGDGGAACPVAPAPSSAPASSGPGAGAGAGAGPGTPPLAGSPPLISDTTATALAAERTRAAALRVCLREVSDRARQSRRLIVRGSARQRSDATRRRRRRDITRARSRCLHRYGRSPDRVNALGAEATGSRSILLTFQAVGTDHERSPVSRRYLIKQSTRPIRTLKDFYAAHPLCSGNCTFDVTTVGATITLRVTDLRPQSRYYYVIVGRDNVSARVGPRSSAVQVRTR